MLPVFGLEGIDLGRGYVRIFVDQVRQHLLPPLVIRCLHLLHHVGMLRGDVELLADVFLEVVQFPILVATHQAILGVADAALTVFPRWRPPFQSTPTP